MRTDEELAASWGPDVCPLCEGKLGDDRHLVRSIVPLEFEVNGCTEYTKVYPVCSSCFTSKELV